MRTTSPKTAQFGDLIAAVFDQAALHSTNPREVSRLATLAVTGLLERGLGVGFGNARTRVGAMRGACVAAAVALALLLTPGTAAAQNGLSMGLVLGDPTGLTLRSGFGARDAIQAHFGFGAFPGDGVTLMVDWTRDAWDFLRNNQSASLFLFGGVGGKAQWFTGRYYAYRHNFSDQTHFGLGVRGLVGLRASFRDAPFDVFLELAPIGIIFVVPNAGAYYDIDGAIGVRYRF